MTPIRSGSHADSDSRSRSLAGLVIAGGYSTRFGDRDKAVADLAGTPMIRRVVDRLATVTDAVVVNCRDDQLEPIRDALTDCEPSIRFATDPVEDQGPVAGIRVGCETVEREYAAVVACDMPFVEPALLELLFDRVRGRDGSDDERANREREHDEREDDDVDAAVVQLEDGWYQTTQAVYRADAMVQACAETLASDDRRILAALERLEYVTVDESELEAYGIDDATFESIDTQEALETAADRLE